MRVRAETVLIAVMSAFALAGVTAVAVQKWQPEVPTVQIQPVQVDPGPVPVATNHSDDASAWFQSVRQYCNPVEVETRLRWQPAPQSPDGAMHEAACYALAGKIDLARTVIDRLPEAMRYQAAGVVFNMGHPAADAGDELAAGPLMGLVVEYWPNHYMALYHAGAASFERGDYPASQRYLTRFLEEYSVEDGWRSAAVTMLDEMGA